VAEVEDLLGIRLDRPATPAEPASHAEPASPADPADGNTMR
jgi:hypothetical protein